MHQHCNRDAADEFAAESDQSPLIERNESCSEPSSTLLDQFVRNYWEFIIAAARKVLRGERTSYLTPDDLAQDVFLAYCYEFNRNPDARKWNAGQVRRWVAAVLHNMWCDNLKKGGKCRRDYSVPLHEVAASESKKAQALEASESIDLLFARLSAEDRWLVLAVEVGGVPIEEAAGKLNLQVPTATRRKNRALAEVRQRAAEEKSRDEAAHIRRGCHGPAPKNNREHRKKLLALASMWFFAGFVALAHVREQQHAEAEAHAAQVESLRREADRLRFEANRSKLLAQSLRTRTNPPVVHSESSAASSPQRVDLLSPPKVMADLDLGFGDAPVAGAEFWKCMPGSSKFKHNGPGVQLPEVAPPQAKNSPPQGAERVNPGEKTKGSGKST